jgi:AcrR family transcriptional regulator
VTGPERDPRPTLSRRAARKHATELALRRAAVTLVAAHGYEGTSTDEIARAAGVSPRTFFNYFATKEAVITMPEQVLPQLVAAALRRRPPDEDPLAALAAASMDTFETINELAGRDDELILAAMQVMFTEPALRRIMLDRRARAEEAVWLMLQARGVRAGDLATRSGVATIVALSHLAMQLWVETRGAEPLTAVLAQCLRLAPDPARLAAGVATSRPIVQPAGEASG